MTELIKTYTWAESRAMCEQGVCKYHAYDLHIVIQHAPEASMLGRVRKGSFMDTLYRYFDAFLKENDK